MSAERPAPNAAGRNMEFLPLHQLIRHENGRVIRYVTNARTASAGSPVQRPLSADGVHFSVWGQPGVHSMALELDTRGLTASCALVLTVSRFDPADPDLPEETVHTTRLSVSRDEGDGPVMFSLMGATLGEGRLYRVSLRPDGAGVQGACGVWGCLTAQPIPKPAVDVTNAVRREPAYRLEWREQGARLRTSTEPLLAERFGLIPLPIASHSGLEFAFDVPATAIDRLSVRVAPRTARGSVPLQLELHDDAGDLILLRSVRPMPRPKAHYVDFDLSQVRFQAGRRYRASLTSPTASPDDCNCVLVNQDGLPAHLPPPRPCLLGIDSAFARYAERARRGAGPATRLRAIAVVPDDHPRPGAAVAALARAFPDHALHTLSLTGNDWGALYARLAEQDVVVFVDVLPGSGEPTRLFDEMVFLLHAGLTGTVHLDTATAGLPAALPGLQLDGRLQRLLIPAQQTARRCHYALTVGADGRPAWADGRDGRPPDPGAMRAAVAKQGLPHIAVVAVLRRMEEADELFLRSVLEQSYGGPVSVVLVDDAASEDARGRLDTWLRRRRGRTAVTVLRNDRAIGDAASHDRAIAAALDAAIGADICLVVDGGGPVGRDFLTAHAFEHQHPEIDAVVGPPGVEARGRDPRKLLATLEADRQPGDGETALRDPVQRDGFVNCGSGNLSVKAEALRRLATAGRGLFVPASNSDSGPGNGGDGHGHGFDGIGFGYRLHAAGARIRHTPRALSVRIADTPSADAAVDGLMRDFNRLFRTHPELALTARRWAAGTADTILEAARRTDRLHRPDYAEMKARFAPAPGAAALRRTAKRPLRILSYRWHCGHQYELHKLPHQFTLVRGLGPGMTSAWDFEQRPLRPNVRFIDQAELDPSQYDVAILHFDENVLAPNLGAGALPDDWGNAFRWLLANVPLPKVAICHGTPPFVGQYGTIRGPIDRFEIHEAERQALVGLLAEHDVPVVVNAWQAQAEWGFARSRVIWHGFDPQEYPPARYERDVLALGSSLWERPHYRGAYEHQRVVDCLPADIGVETAANQDGGLWPRGTNDGAVSRFRGYVDRVRAFTAYLDTTRRSPMPRSRGEAMMCGVVPVCLRSDDVDLFIRHGVNGFCGDSPEELADYLTHLCRNRDAARRIGERARLTAMDLFNHDRYLAAWTELLEEVTEDGRRDSGDVQAVRTAAEAPAPTPLPAPAPALAPPPSAPALPTPPAPETAAEPDAAAAQPGFRFAGAVDWMVQSRLSGWAVDLEQPEQPPLILLHVDGAVRYRFAAAVPRPDATLGSPAHGAFQITLPAELSDGRPHRIDLTIDGSDTLLNEQPLWLCNPDPQARFAGRVDGFTGRMFFGWWQNLARPSRPVTLVTIIDGRIQGNLTADQPRPGLRMIGMRSEHCGFVWQLPASLRDGKEHELLLANASTAQPLPGFPARVRLAPTGPAWCGYVAATPDGDITGWVYDDEDLGRAVAVDILVDGRPYRTVDADGLRPDLKALGARKTNCGFRIRPPRIADKPEVTLHVRVAGTGHNIAGSPIRLDLTRTYRSWIERYDRIDDAKRAVLRARVAGLPRRPLLSILMPVYNTPERLLRAAIASVRRQIYPDWELCIADDASTDPRVAEVLAEESGRDSRIRVVRRAANGHIAAASNSALELARGEFTVLLDHDDELSEHALLLLAEEILAHPEATLLFSDEDKIDEEGERFDPYFKSAFNPDLLATQNCISHLGAYRTDLMRRLGGFTVGLEGSQDYDLAWRVVEHSPPGAIRHIPHILYHWRATAGSTALAMDEKDYAAKAMRRGLEVALDRQGRRARLFPSLHPPFLHSRPRLAEWPSVSLLVSSGGDAGRLAACLSALETQTARPVTETIVVCPKPAAEALGAVAAARRGVRLLPVDGLLAARRNAAAAAATGRVLVFLDDDVEPLHRIWLAELVRQCMAPGIGAVAPSQILPSGQIRSTGYTLGLLGHGASAYAGQPLGVIGPGARAVLMQTVSAVTASCLAVQRDHFATCGGFDSANLPQALHDIDFCLRLPAQGLRCLYTPFAQMLSRDPDPPPPPPVQEVDVLRERWGAAFTEDPYYNVNLSLETTSAELAFPPRPVLA